MLVCDKCKKEMEMPETKTLVRERTNHHVYPFDIQGFDEDGKMVELCLWSDEVDVERSVIRQWIEDNTTWPDGTYQVGFHDQLERKHGEGVAGQEHD